jgi:DNA repair exonuclease SbcCD ATPase subunit
MKLHSVTVRNYRIHRELTVAFDEALTVIGGPNEAGKTTVVEAVHRALFLRSRASGAVLDSMRSAFHPGHPAVELTFESGGTLYTVTKQFTGTNTAPTTLAVTGGQTLRNDEAEAALRELVQAEAIGGRNSEDKLRMQWAHLWVWQGVAGADPLDRDAMQEPLERLRGRLGSLDEGGVVESQTDATVGRIVAETHAARTRDTGAARVDSPLGKADATLTEARTRVAAARAAIGQLEAAIASVERADTIIAESETSLVARRAEQEKNERLLLEAQSLEVRQAEQQAAATAAAARLAAVADADRQIRDCEARITAIEARRTPTAARQTAAIAAEQEATTRCAAAQAAARERQREHAELGELAELHRQAEHLEQRRSERAGLAGRCGRIADLRQEAAALHKRLADLPAVTAADLADLASHERGRDAAQAKLDAIATRVELVAAESAVRLGDHELAVGRSETIVADTPLEAGGARLVITPGGGTSVAEATRLRDAAATALESRLRQLGVADLDEARRVQPLRQTVEAALEAKRSAIADLGDTKADAELAALDAELAELEETLRGQTRPDFSRPVGLEAATVARKAITERLRSLAHDVATTAAEQQAAEQRLAEARLQREQAADEIRAIDGELRDAQVRRDVLVEEHGDQRDEAIAAATQARTSADEQLAATQTALQRLQPELLRKTAARLQRAIEKLLTDSRAAIAERTVALERLRNEGTLDPRDDLAQALAAERVAEAAQRQAAREARAHALLARLFAEKKAEIEAQFVAPLAERVAGYLRCLFGADATMSIGYAGDMFTSLELTRPDFGGIALAFRRLSGGAREQVAAAFRLAMAEILASEHGGCLPIVFDDAFVNADPSRLAGIQAMLDRAADQGLQVIVLSCNHRDYDALGATTVELPKAGISRGVAEPGAAAAPAGNSGAEAAES